MIIRLCYGRRVQASLKLIGCILIAVFYFAFLFRESLNAFEQNKEKAEAAAAAVGLIQINKIEVKIAQNSKFLSFMALFCCLAKEFISELQTLSKGVR